jgi:hypothetical protein
MALVTIEETRVETQKIVSAVFRSTQDLIPESIEDEATRNANDDYCMTEIHETTFNLRLQSNRIDHNGLPGVFTPAKLDFSQQDNQVILGLREDSVKAYWVHDGGRTLIENRNDPRQTEYVNIKTTDDTVEIKFMFEIPDEAVSHFEFTFQLLTKLKPEFTEIQPENYEMGLQDIITLDDSANAIINITDHEQVSFCQTSNLNNSLHQPIYYTDQNNRAGRLHGNQQQNMKFQLTSAELHMTNCYKVMDTESAGEERS